MRVAWGTGQALKKAQVPACPGEVQRALDEWIWFGLESWHYVNGQLVAYVRWDGPSRQVPKASWVAEP